MINVYKENDFVNIVVD